mgnify:CR=1 FL=1
MNLQQNCVILYLAYGKKNIFNQVLFSILTLHYHNKYATSAIKIVVYTDRPEFFSKYNVALNLQLEILTPQVIEQYKGKNNFIHRVKICVIKDCIEKYKANVFYLDSDTFFKKAPLELISQIDSATSIMNSNDYDLQHADELYENEDWLKIRRAIRDFEYVIGGKAIKIPLATRMWNAGVIGISYVNKEILVDVLNLTDQIYNNKKVFTAEQFAFSYFLQNRTQLITTGDVIMHYWPNHIGMYWKNQYDQYLSNFFNKNRSASINQMAEAAYELSKSHDIITSPPKPDLLDKINKRLLSVWKVAKTGKL